MDELFAKSLVDRIPFEAFISVASLGVTMYFWLVKARREQPFLEIHQIHDFRAQLRQNPSEPETKRLCISQIDTGGILVANQSTRQNSVLRFDCYLETADGLLAGTWGYTGEDKPPWNVGPETTLAISPAMFFVVPPDFQVPAEMQFTIELITVSGRRFSSRLSLSAPI